MASPTPRLNQALDLLRAALGPAVQVSLIKAGDHEPAVTLTPAHGTRRTLRLRDPDHPATESRLWAWLVTRATPPRRQHWRDRDENFVDMSGAVRLHLPGIHIDRTDLAPAQRLSATRETSQTRNPFSDRASFVLRTLLEEPPQTWTTTGLAKKAGVSIATVSLATEALRAANLLHVRRQGREREITLDNPTALFTQWARRYDWTRSARVGFAAPVGEPERFLRRLPKVLTHRKWALTLQAGASLIAPHARWDTTHVYVDVDEPRELVDIGAAAGWRPSDTGSVVLLKPYYHTSVWDHASVQNGLNVVSRTQLVLDLWDYPLRGREQAEHLMRAAGWLDG
jgi:hypothetical protein